MNILEIANYNAPYAGNFILSLKNMESHLKNGKMVYLFPQAANDKEFINELNTVYFYTGSFIHDIKIIYKIVKMENINIIHSHFASSKESIILKFIALLKPEVKFIRHVHNKYNKATGVRKIIRKIIRSHFDAFFACSDPIYDQLIDDGIKPQKTFSVINAIDFKRLDKYERIEKEAGIQIFMFGFDWYRKGGDIAIKAISNLENITLNIVLSTNTKEVIEFIKKDFGKIPDFVNFLPARNDVSTIYHQADIFLAPSRSEGFNYSVVEAMYCETLVIASDIAPHAKILPSDFLFQSENYSDLRNLISKTLNLKNSKEITTKFKLNALEKYNIDVWSSKSIQIFNQLK